LNVLQKMSLKHEQVGSKLMMSHCTHLIAWSC